MESSVFYGGSVLAAFFAGGIALFAPCCISVMLPAYFASFFQNRRLLVAMTFLFAVGVATVILPIALGASALRQLFTEQHMPIYVTAGLLMLALGAYTLLGGQLHLPMPGRRAGGAAGPWSVYTLGAFSAVLTWLGADFTTTFTASITALGNIGPGLASVGPMLSFAELHPISRSLLIFDMYAERLELVTAFVVFGPYLWQAPNFSLARRPSRARRWR